MDLFSISISGLVSPFHHFTSGTMYCNICNDLKAIMIIAYNIDNCQESKYILNIWRYFVIMILVYLHFFVMYGEVFLCLWTILLFGIRF